MDTVVSKTKLNACGVAVPSGRTAPRRGGPRAAAGNGSREIAAATALRTAVGDWWFGTASAWYFAVYFAVSVLAAASSPVTLFAAGDVRQLPLAQAASFAFAAGCVGVPAVAGHWAMARAVLRPDGTDGAFFACLAALGARGLASAPELLLAVAGNRAVLLLAAALAVVAAARLALGKAAPRLPAAAFRAFLCRAAIAVGAAALALQLFGGGLVERRIDYPAGAAAPSSEACAAAAVALFDGSWDSLGVAERADVAAAVVLAESSWLGLEHPPAVRVTTMLRPSVLGTYDGRGNVVRINAAYLMLDGAGAAANVLDTCLHESFHAFQMECARIGARPGDSKCPFDVPQEAVDAYRTHFLGTSTYNTHEFVEAFAREYSAHRMGVISSRVSRSLGIDDPFDATHLVEGIGDAR